MHGAVDGRPGNWHEKRFGLDAADEKRFGVPAAENVKRTRFEDAPKREAWFDQRYDDLERVLAFTELKTIWHPALI